MAGYAVPVNNTAVPLQFLLVLSSDHITGATGKTVTVTLAKNDGLGFVAATGVVTELGNGVYSLSPSTSDASVLGPLQLHATASACDPLDEEFLVVNYNPLYATPSVTATTDTTTVRAFLTSVLRRIKITGIADTADANELGEVFTAFQLLLNSFGAQRFLKYTMSRSTWTLSTSKGTPTNPYTVGSGGDIDIARPEVDDIIRITYSNSTWSPTYPLEIPLPLLSEDGWSGTAMKTLANVVPTFAYYEPSYPYGHLYTWMIPTATTLTGAIYHREPIAVLGSLEDICSWPPGYGKAIRDLMVVEAWPIFKDGEPTALMQRAAQTATENLVAMNLRMSEMGSNYPTAGGFYDAYSGTNLS